MMGEGRIDAWLSVGILLLAGCQTPTPNLKPKMTPEYVLPPTDDARFSSPPSYPKEMLDTGQFKKEEQAKPGDKLKDQDLRFGGPGMGGSKMGGY